MTELVDYSGGFDPTFSHEKLNRETLLKLLRAYNDYMLRIDGYWYLTVMNKWGNDEAFDCDIKVWEKAQLWEMRTISSLLNIHGDDVETLMKYVQVSPWMWIYTFNIDLKSQQPCLADDHQLPHTDLPREGRNGSREAHLPGIGAETDGHSSWLLQSPDKGDSAQSASPNGYRDCCCQWEFRLDR